VSIILLKVDFQSYSYFKDTLRGERSDELFPRPPQRSCYPQVVLQTSTSHHKAHL